MQAAGGHQGQLPGQMSQELPGPPALLVLQAQQQMRWLNEQHAVATQQSEPVDIRSIAGLPRPLCVPHLQWALLPALAPNQALHGLGDARRQWPAAAQRQSEDEEAREGPTAAAEPACGQDGRSGAATAVAASQPGGNAPAKHTAGQADRLFIGSANKRYSLYNRLRRFATLCQGVFARAGLCLGSSLTTLGLHLS